MPPEVDRGYLPYRRAASAFMRWQLRRGLLNPASAPTPGSPWWRTLNESLLRDVCEASALAFGRPGRRGLRGGGHPRLHREADGTYLVSRAQCVDRLGVSRERAPRPQEGRVERFFINLVLVRVLYAHALVAEPGLALGRLAPLGRPLGDPRLGITGIFLSLSRILPADYPLGEDVESYVVAEHGFGHLVDVGIIVPRLDRLYDWSAAALGISELCALFDPGRGVPSYAWDPEDAAAWHPPPSLLARLAGRASGTKPGGPASGPAQDG